MKKLISMMLVLVLCLSLCACGGSGGNNIPETTQAPTVAKPKTPTVASVVEGIKNEFKDPDSVQITDGSWAYVEKDGEKVENEFYIICTVRAKNSFGGYANPQAYVIHCKNSNYRIVEEYNDYAFMTQKKFNELGCGASMGLK